MALVLFLSVFADKPTRKQRAIAKQIEEASFEETAGDESYCSYSLYGSSKFPGCERGCAVGEKLCEITLKLTPIVSAFADVLAPLTCAPAKEQCEKACKRSVRQKLTKGKKILFCKKDATFSQCKAGAYSPAKVVDVVPYFGRSTRHKIQYTSPSARHIPPFEIILRFEYIDGDARKVKSGRAWFCPSEQRSVKIKASLKTRALKIRKQLGY